VSDFHDAIRLGPTNAYGYNGLAWLLATCPTASLRDGKQAVELATKACGSSDWRSWFCVGTLGAAYAEAGDFEKAIQYQKRALAMSGLTDKQRAEAEQRLALYEQHQAYRESPSH
jgi:tetratricopeptide (TPR) repeat protein